MRIFAKLYDKALIWSKHRRAPYYLAGLSFAEASFFPIPPDVMLAPMVLAQRKKAWMFALITTAASALGGAFGYLIGYTLYKYGVVDSLMSTLNWTSHYESIRVRLNGIEGFLLIFTVGFTLIPYKIFTITAGAVAQNFFLFFVASVVGRGARFFLVAGAIYFGGEKLEHNLRKYIDIVTWVIIALIVGFIIYKWVT